jgi:hypothetical protein
LTLVRRYYGHAARRFRQKTCPRGEAMNIPKQQSITLGLWRDVMTDLGKVLIGVGILLVVAGVVVTLLGRANLPLGRLPGDIVYRGKNSSFYFPLATSLLVSVLLSLVLYVVGRFRR